MLECSVWASGLSYPEGPVWASPDRLLCVEVGRGTLVEIGPGGVATVIADCGGGPNGLALDAQWAFVCNNGGVAMRKVGDLDVPGPPTDANQGGSIQRVDLKTGDVETLYDSYEGKPLQAPNDLVLDGAGGFWFTDHGHHRGWARDHGAVYWGALDGGELRRVIYPIDTPNGVGLSPTRDELYVAETSTGRLWSWAVERPGEVSASGDPFAPQGGTLVAGLPGHRKCDSLRIDESGTIYLATLITGEITVISPSPHGWTMASLPVAPADPLITNLALGPQFTAITSSGRGRVLLVDSNHMQRAGGSDE